MGLNIFKLNSPRSWTIPCNSAVPVDDVEATLTASTSTLNYDSTADQYNYVWKTDKTWAGQCRVFELDLSLGGKNTPTSTS